MLMKIVIYNKLALNFGKISNMKFLLQYFNKIQSPFMSRKFLFSLYKYLKKDYPNLEPV